MMVFADPRREILGTMLDDVQAHIGAMVEDLMASVNGDKEEIYKVGLHATPLLESLSEVVVAWQLLHHAEIAIPKIDTDAFYRGKVESARWYIKDVAPNVAARRARATAEDGSLMDLPVDAF